ncbi:MAG: tryptophan synthase subunit alpha [Lachnospiraceae bacterium]|nr:tryptophan synthase subunit alpha [Lachnospiraceae bacterium]
MSHWIREAFAGKKAFITYVTCGDPDLSTTRQILLALNEVGVDMIELGFPFSDPTGEGPVILQSNLRALDGGLKVDDAFALLEHVREEIEVPIIIRTYANVVYAYGKERFIMRASEAGADGLLLSDVPFEEKEEFAPICRRYGIDMISLIAPTSEDRIEKIASEAEGFVYCISSLGVTGMREEITTDIRSMVEAARRYADIPVAIGFGISTPEQAAEMAQIADGVIVGSAIVKLIGDYGHDAIEEVSRFVQSMREAID